MSDDKEIKVVIDPVTADRVCRQALRRYAVRKGLDDKRNFQVLNWHYILREGRSGDSELASQDIVFTGHRKS